MNPIVRTALLAARRQQEAATFTPHKPTPRQEAFLGLACREALYGGAAGGGKSDALLMAALEYVHVPTYSALILRRTFADLNKPGSLIPRSHDWLSGKASWDGQNKTWRFASGAVITFGYLETEIDKYQYQSAEYQFIGFDELTQFSESVYTYLFSRLRRSSESPVPLRMRAASNPGGIGHDWVRDRFIPPEDALPDASGIFRLDDQRAYVPARLDDNPHIDREAYIGSLMELDPTTRAQLLQGNWDARPTGGYFRRQDWRYTDVAPIGLTWIRFWDFAATDPRPGRDPDWLAGALVGRDELTGRTYIADMVRFRGAPPAVEQVIRQTAEADGLDVGIWFEEEPGSQGRMLTDSYQRTILAAYDVNVLRASTRGSKTALAGPLASQAEAGNVTLVRGTWNKAFIEEADAFPSPDVHDDQIDAASSAYYVLTGSAWRRTPHRRRANTAFLQRYEQLMVPCSSCQTPVYWPSFEVSATCPACGYENIRQ